MSADKLPAPAKRYMRDFGLAMTMYVLVLMSSVYVLERFELPTWSVVLIALAPVAPVLVALRAYIVFINAADELQRRIQHEAILIAAAVTGFGSFAYGFLEGAGRAPHLPLVFILPAMIAVWGIASVFVSRRYR